MYLVFEIRFQEIIKVTTFLNFTPFCNTSFRKYFSASKEHLQP